MPIRKQKRYTRAEIQANPNTIYVFGDNFRMKGYGGQAYEARGEPNAFGIPTKLTAGDYLNRENMKSAGIDASYIVNIIHAKFQHLFILLDMGVDVVWPEDGVGTGLADLKRQCPELYFAIEEASKLMFETYGEDVVH